MASRQAFLTLLGACLLNLLFGSLYLWGTLSLYIASYFRLQDPAFTPDHCLLMFPFLGLTLHFTAIFGFKVAKTVGFRKNLLFSVLFCSFSAYFGLFFKDFSAFFLIYGLFMGVSIGLGILVTLFNACSHFPAQKGLITGLILAFFGLSAMFQAVFLMKTLNPDNLSPEGMFFPAEVVKDLPETMRKLGFIYLGVGLLGVLLSFEHKTEGSIEDLRLIKVPQSDKTTEKREKSEKRDEFRLDIVKNSEKNVKKHENSEKGDENRLKMAQNLEKTGEKTRKVLKSRVFWLLMGMLVLSSSNGFFIAVNFKTLGELAVPDDHFLTLVAGVGAVCNGAGRFLWGIISDRLGFRLSYQLLLALQILEGLLLKTALFSNKWLFLGCVGLGFYCLGGNFVLFPCFCTSRFGDSGRQVYGFLQWGGFLGNLLQTGVVLVLKDIIGLENVGLVFVLAGVGSWIGLALQGEKEEK